MRHVIRRQPPPSFEGTKVGSFSLWLPLDSVEEVSKADGTSEMRIAGICTTNDKDLQGETVLTQGLDWRYARKRGWFNEEHDRSVKGGVGIIDKVEELVRLGGGRTGARVEGYLLPTERGKAIFEVAQKLKGTGRTLGFSIQGPILARQDDDAKVVTKATVMDVAITRHPVNPYTTLEVLAKSLAEAEKSLDAGHPAASYSGGGSGSALIPQSLEGKEANMACKGKIKAFSALPAELQDKALKAAGVNTDDMAEDDEGEDDEIEKSLAAVEAHLRAGKPVILDDDAVAAVGADPTGLLKNVQVALEQMYAGQGILAKSLMAVGRLAQAALDKPAAPALPEGLADLPAFQAEVRNTLGEVSKALKIPAVPKSVQAAPVVARPDVLGGGGPQGEFVTDQGALRKSLMAAATAGNLKALELLPQADVRGITTQELAAYGIPMLPA